MGAVKEDYDSYCYQCCKQGEALPERAALLRAQLSPPSLSAALCVGCCCIFTHKILVVEREALVHKYSLELSQACCGRVDNCCGATCCKPNLIIDILDASGNLTDGAVAKTWARGANCDGCFRGI